MNIYTLDVKSYDNEYISVDPLIDYISNYGHIKSIGSRYGYTNKDTNSPSGEVYGQSVDVVMDNDAYTALTAVQRGQPGYQIQLTMNNFKYPEANDRKHSLYIAMADLSEAISENRTDIEDYVPKRQTIVAPWVGKSYSAYEIAAVILTPGILQAVKKNTDVGFELQFSYADDIVKHIAADVIALIENALPLDAKENTLTKLVAAVLVTAKEIILKDVNEVLHVYLASDIMISAEIITRELNAKIAGQVLAKIHKFSGYNNVIDVLRLRLNNLLIEQLNKGRKKQDVVDHLVHQLTFAKIMIQNIDTVVKKLDAKNIVSYFAIGLLVMEELSGDLLEAGNAAIKDSNYGHFSKVIDKLYGVTYSIVYDYLETIYPHKDSPLGAAVIAIVRKDLASKLDVAVNAGVINSGDYQIDFYISDDVYSFAYGFINFRQDVTPYQVGLVKAILETMYWTFKHTENDKISLRINKL